MADFGSAAAITEGVTYLTSTVDGTIMSEKNWRDVFKDGRVPAAAFAAGESPLPPALSEKLSIICSRIFTPPATAIESPNSPDELAKFEKRVMEGLLAGYHTPYPVSCLQKIDFTTLQDLVKADDAKEGRTAAQKALGSSSLLKKLPDEIQYGFHDNLYKPRDYKEDLVTIHGPGAVMDPFTRTIPTSQFTGAGNQSGQTVYWFPTVTPGMQPAMWRQLGFETLQTVEATYSGGTVTVVINAGNGPETYTMDLQGNVLGATPTPNPFGGNADKNKWLRITNIASTANRRNADKLVLFKEALGDTKQVIDAKLFLGNRGSSGCVFTSDNVVLLMSLAANVACCAGILKGASDPTRQLHQGMTYLPSGSIDPMAVKAGFRRMCAEYNAKQVATILNGLNYGFISVDGDDNASINPSLADALRNVGAFATDILTLLDKQMGDLDIPTFKQLCVSCYIVNIVSRTSKGFKVNQYKTLLKPNSKFTKLGIVFPSDPLVGITSRKTSSSSKRRTRKSRRRAQRGGEVEKPGPLVEGGFLYSTQSFYDIAAGFEIGDKDDIYDFLGFCYPYYEYVGECGAHMTMIYKLLDYYFKIAPSLDADLSVYDLNDFEEWYLAELGKQTERALQDDIDAVVARDDEDKYTGNGGGPAGGGPPGGGGGPPGGGGGGGTGPLPPPSAYYPAMPVTLDTSVGSMGDNQMYEGRDESTQQGSSSSINQSPSSRGLPSGSASASMSQMTSPAQYGQRRKGPLHPLGASSIMLDETSLASYSNETAMAASSSLPQPFSLGALSPISAQGSQAPSNNEDEVPPQVAVPEGGGGPPPGGGGGVAIVEDGTTYQNQTVVINGIQHITDVTNVETDEKGRVRSTGSATIDGVTYHVRYDLGRWVVHPNFSRYPYTRKRSRKTRNNRRKTLRRRNRR